MPKAVAETITSEKLRARMAAAVDKLLAAMDALDADPDAEANGDGEPSLGSLGSLSEHADQTAWARGTDDDREDEHDGAELDVEDEPSLGSFDGMMDQTKSYRRVQNGPTASAPEDAEYDPAEKEPSLGSVGSCAPVVAQDLDQERWAAGGSLDVAQDDGEHGIADPDGYIEQRGGQWNGAVVI